MERRLFFIRTPTVREWPGLLSEPRQNGAVQRAPPVGTRGSKHPPQPRRNCHGYGSPRSKRIPARRRGARGWTNESGATADFAVAPEGSAHPADWAAGYVTSCPRASSRTSSSSWNCQSHPCSSPNRPRHPWSLRFPRRWWTASGSRPSTGRTDRRSAR